MKCKPLGQLVLITDALRATKTELKDDSELYFDQCFHRKADDVIIGSAITMLDGFKNIISYGVPIEKAVRMASTNPAKIMKQPDLGLIIPGYKADLIVFNQDFTITHTIIDGEILKGENK